MDLMIKERWLVALAVVVSSLVMSACSKSPNPKENYENTLLEEVASLRREVDSLALSVANSELSFSELRDLKGRVDQYDYQQAAQYMVTFTPSSEGYSIIKTDVGNLTVDLRGISQYANGVRINLRIGNPLSGSLNGVKFQVSYGEVDERGLPKRSGTKTKEVSLEKSLRAGGFNDLRIVLENISPKKLGFVSVGNIQSSGITLTLP
jgi:hypothetical protein